MTEINADTDWGVLSNYTLMPELLDSGINLAAELRARNARITIPACWAVATGEIGKFDRRVTDLEFGIHGDVGALLWHDEPHGSCNPADGRNTDHVEYRMAGMHTTYLPPGVEVPIELVYEAVAEYQRTRQRPTCIDWVPCGR